MERFDQYFLLWLENAPTLPLQLWIFRYSQQHHLQSLVGRIQIRMIQMIMSTNTQLLIQKQATILIHLLMIIIMSWMSMIQMKTGMQSGKVLKYLKQAGAVDAAHIFCSMKMVLCAKSPFQLDDAYSVLLNRYCQLLWQWKL